MRKRIRTATSLAFAFVALAASAAGQRPAASAAPAFVVVVHTNNPLTTIEREQLSRIFLKRALKWPDGTPVEPIDLNVKQPSRAAFSQTVHRKPLGAVRAFWQQQIFSGRDVPPAEKASETDVLSYVTEHVSAVGYVSPTTALGPGVKVLDITGIAQ